ncbi:MAG: hydroxymethylglutaryl-CoA reductase [Pseudomonadota bacterium]
MTSDRIPRSAEDDYTEAAAARRRDFIQERTGAELRHTGQYSAEPAVFAGNIENFTGIVQMPVGFAGPLLVNGEHAQGEFYVPFATTEGTLVASYDRGMSVTRAAGGVTVTVVDDAMQRAPVFVFNNAREARDFSRWLKDFFGQIKQAAEATTSSGKLRDIQQFAASKMVYLRFNYTTGDAAGQNMSGKATDAACKWILDRYDGPIERFVLSGSMDTDKKYSQINTLHTRGKRVIAEVTLPRALLQERMRTTPEAMFAARLTSQLGGLMAGTTLNGIHPANGVAAMFIATGQDEANTAESGAGLIYAEVTPDGDYYFSLTIPSLIVATHGGGTALPTQRECLGALGCVGSGKVRKFAEIVGAALLCGELSLSAAIVADEWVESHDAYGRNR